MLGACLTPHKIAGEVGAYLVNFSPVVGVLTWDVGDPGSSHPLPKGERGFEQRSPTELMSTLIWDSFLLKQYDSIQSLGQSESDSENDSVF